ncbi:MAG TPA: DUF11 domain-containing protein, partial [Verrucomicrobiae bacterium]|nr:DUF11 domain-containing protein [Verrucomicrobiae bacterium]
AAGTITNTATVSAAETDPNTADNDASIMTTVSPATFLGPSPYLCQTDSPFFAAIQAGTVFLETFEDGMFNAPGVSALGTVVGPGGNTDSVDCDDGNIDGSGTFGRSLFFTPGSTGITFTFNPTTLGGFPTQAGIVWTDAGFGATVTFEAFDAGGGSLGVVQAIALADNTNFGTTAEDRFFGVTNPGGISAIKISNTSGGIEVDHLQYGPVPPFADLAVTKLDTPDPVNIGANITYDITVTNNGPVDATGVTLTDTLPAGVTFVSATPSQGTCSGTVTVNCDLIDILAGSSATVTLVVTANAVGSVSNTASATATEVDFNLANNSATATTTVSPLAD